MGISLQLPTQNYTGSPYGGEYKTHHTTSEPIKLTDGRELYLEVPSLVVGTAQPHFNSNTDLSTEQFLSTNGTLQHVISAHEHRGISEVC
jgi:hypothetical protein